MKKVESEKKTYCNVKATINGIEIVVGGNDANKVIEEFEILKKKAIEDDKK